MGCYKNVLGKIFEPRCLFSFYWGSLITHRSLNTANNNSIKSFTQVNTLIPIWMSTTIDYNTPFYQIDEVYYNDLFSSNFFFLLPFIQSSHAWVLLFILIFICGRQMRKSIIRTRFIYTIHEGDIIYKYSFQLEYRSFIFIRIRFRFQVY